MVEKRVLAMHGMRGAFQPCSQLSPPKTHYGRLQHIVSVEFPNGCNSPPLAEGTVFAFALFHRCTLAPEDPQMSRLNIHSYSGEERHLEITDATRVRSLVGRVKDGPNSWAIVDRGGKFSREAYLTHEAS